MTDAGQIDHTFDPPLIFHELDDGARDGGRQLLRRGDDYVVAQWTGDFWSYPYGDGRDEGDCPVEIDFSPTHYSPRRSGASHTPGRPAA